MPAPALFAKSDLAATRADDDLGIAPGDPGARAWAAFWAMFSTAWISCSRSPRKSGSEMS